MTTASLLRPFCSLGKESNYSVNVNPILKTRTQVHYQLIRKNRSFLIKQRPEANNFRVQCFMKSNKAGFGEEKEEEKDRRRGNSLDEIIQEILKTLNLVVQKTAIAGVILGLLMTYNPHLALAASGGRMGGRSFSSSSSSSSPSYSSGSSSSSSSSPSYSSGSSSSSSWNSYSSSSDDDNSYSYSSGNSYSSSPSYWSSSIDWSTPKNYYSSQTPSVSEDEPETSPEAQKSSINEDEPKTTPEAQRLTVLEVLVTIVIIAGVLYLVYRLSAAHEQTQSSRRFHEQRQPEQPRQSSHEQRQTEQPRQSSHEQRQPKQSRQSSVDTTNAATVIMLQVALLGATRSLQKDLDKIAEVADTSTTSGLSYILKESTVALIRHLAYCFSSYSYVDVKPDKVDGEKLFNMLTIEERAKFDEETLVNVDNIKKQSTPSKKPNGLSSDYIVMTILVAAMGELKLGVINNSDDLRKALQKLGSISTSKILAVEVMWTPQEENDILTECEMLEDYPRLKPL